MVSNEFSGMEGFDAPCTLQPSSCVDPGATVSGDEILELYGFYGYSKVRETVEVLKTHVHLKVSMCSRKHAKCMWPLGLYGHSKARVCRFASVQQHGCMRVHACVHTCVCVAV